MGTRSLSSLLVFSAYVSWKQDQAHKENAHFLPLLALEEPEAHLHPQSQRSLFSQILNIPGQRIVSTHSPYFAGQAQLEQLRLFLRRPHGVEVASLDTSRLRPDERRRIEREVLATRGDLLFAKAIILCEGETEEQFLPVIAEAYWGRSVHELGLCFIGVGGSKNYFSFVYLAQQLHLSYFLFSDGEPDTRTALANCMSRIPPGLSLESMANVIIIPNDQDLEGHLIESGYQVEAEKALTNILKGNLEDYIRDFDGKPKKGGKLRDYRSEGGQNRALLDALRENKTRAAPALAAALVNLKDPDRLAPPAVRALLQQMSHDLRLTPR